MITELNHIIETYTGVCDYTLDEMCVIEKSHLDVFVPEYNKNMFIEKKQHIQRLKNLCDEKILKICKHNFVEDLIDIGLEDSKYIKYCTVCEYTDNNFSLSSKDKQL
jgi:hypothetical protein